ncbi:MAG: hypothetical protein IJT41_02690 [Clostridia bacterium]|nr:hypothetical protein [Clostridia bacterium]
MKQIRKTVSIALCILLAFSCSVPSFAADTGAGEPYSPQAHMLDNVFGVLHDLVFGTVQLLLRQPGIPSYEKYLSQDHPYYYNGTDGITIGDGWRGGFASGSIIPPQWRYNADGKPDPNGLCLRTLRPKGGYQGAITHLYSDQMLNMMILSNGTDSNQNGVADLMILGDVDGVGLTAGTKAKMCAAVEGALREYGVAHEDILSCNFSASHCHVGIDTEGMSIPIVVLKLLPATILNCIPALRPRTLDRTEEKTLCAQASACAKQAFDSMEDGDLYFFETQPVSSGASDKLDSGVKTKNWFSCFLFEGRKSQKKTILANIGAHPTSYDSDGTGLLCTDYPYYMSRALHDAGYNFVFFQGAQANINSPGCDVPEGSDKDLRAKAWVEKTALTHDEWVERYGKAYTDRVYDKKAEDLNDRMRCGFLLADMILDAEKQNKSPVKPMLRVRNGQTLVPLDNGLMGLAAISGLLEEHVVRMPKAESRCGIVVETNYIELGEHVAIFTAPGELSPSLLLGSDPDYTGGAKWTGITSWTGEDWRYDTLTDLVRTASGDSNKTVLLFGLTNDAMGYVYPDICCTQSILGAKLYYKVDGKNMANCMFMTMGTKAASSLMDGYSRVLQSVFG